MVNVSEYKILKLKSKIVEAFYHWIKLKLPDEVLKGLTVNYPDLIRLVFNELDNKDENLENATNCVIELINLAKKKVEFSSIKDAVISKVEKLVGKVDQAVQ